jgi:DNA-binding protein YbaB
MVSSANGASPATVSLAPSAEPTQSVNIQGGSIGTVAVSGDLATMAAAQIQADGKSVSIQSMGESTTVSFQVGNTTVTVTVSGNAQDVTVTRDPATGALTIETQGAAGAEVTVELEDKQTGLSTSYDVNNGTSATSTTSIALPTSGWTGTEPPAATSQVGGSSSTLAGSHCGNNIKDSGETDIDCGGMCGSCSAGQGCLVAGDCESGACNINSKTCAVPSADGIKKWPRNRHRLRRLDQRRYAALRQWQSVYRKL